MDIGAQSRHRLVKIDELRQHEQIDKKHFRKLLDKIKHSGYIEPIIVDSFSRTILDGHHRYNVVKTLGHKTIPAFVIDYKDPDVKVISRRKNIKVSKEEIIMRAINGELYEPKTSRHEFLDLPKIKVDLKETNVAQNVLDLIGNTPIVKINRLNPNPNVAIYAKLEGQNPGGSVKDRIAKSMIEAAEKSGELTKEKIILEPTSGNTGIGLAMVAAVKGYRLVLTMSSGMSSERKAMLRAFGAELIETDPTFGTDGAIMKAKELYKDNPEKYYMPYQFDNPNNPIAHYKTADEIISDIPDITVFIAGMGTFGTLRGVSTRLKEYNKEIKVIGVEPQFGHKIQGMKNMLEAIVPKIYDTKFFDEKFVVYNEEAYEMARQLALKEGIFVGMSSGAAMHAALKYAKEMTSGTIVVLLPDRGEKYLSTVLFS